MTHSRLYMVVLSSDVRFVDRRPECIDEWINEGIEEDQHKQTVPVKEK